MIFIIRIIIDNNGTVFDVTDILYKDVTLTEYIKGTAGILVFSVVRDGIVNFIEGNKVILYVDDVMRFCGFVANKKRDKNQIINVTAYNQIFYLSKNKDTYIYSGKTATQVINTVCGDYGLEIGALCDTGVVIEPRVEEGKTLIDIIQNAIDRTRQINGVEYCFYDDCGKLFLKPLSDMICNTVFSDEINIVNFSYETDISKDTYNVVRLFKKERLENAHLSYMAENSENIKKWGRLQYYENVDKDMNTAQMKAVCDGVFNINGDVKKKLVIEAFTDDFTVRAGNSVLVDMKDFSEIGISDFKIVEKSVHVFSNGKHIIKLDIRV